MQQEYQKRRQALLAKMSVGSAALIFAAPECQRNADNDYPYRQNSDFWYLTGFNEPESVLVLLKQSDSACRCILFNRERDQLAEIWTGRRLGQEAALERLGVDQALPYSELVEELPLLLNGLAVIYHAQGLYAYADEILFSVLTMLRQGARKNWHAPATLTDWRPWLHEMRLFKSEKELQIMRRAGEISALAHTRAMQKCRPGLYEYQLEGEILHEFYRHGARYPAYNTIVGSGDNACILHYTENSDPLREGDLVLIDAGCEYLGYAGDISRTFPVNGRFSTAQREIYDIVLAAQLKALHFLVPGGSIQQANREAIRVMVSGLVALGIMQGEVDTLIEEKTYREFYMHGLGHWLGLDVHDVGDYGSTERERPLEVGMVLTVEPGLYLSPEADIPDRYRGIGIRIEDNIVITGSGHQVLTEGVVKDPVEIELLMAAK